MIVNLTENRFLQQVQKIRLLNWDWLEIHYAAQRKPLSKNVHLCNILPRNYLSYIFESYIFQSYFGGPFRGEGRRDIFQKNTFYVGTNFVGKIYRGIVLQGLMIRLRGKEFPQSVFSSNVNTQNLKIFPNHGGIFTSR